MNQSSEVPNIGQAFHDFTDALGKASTLGYATLKSVVAAGLGKVSYAAEAIRSHSPEFVAKRLTIAYIVYRSFEDLANDLNRQVEETRQAIPKSSLLKRTKILGLAILAALRKKVTPLFPFLAPRPVPVQPPAPPTPEQKAAKATDAISQHLRDLSEGQWDLSVDDASKVEKKYQEFLKEPTNEYALKEWVEEEFPDKDGVDKAPIRDAIVTAFPNLESRSDDRVESIEKAPQLIEDKFKSLPLSWRDAQAIRKDYQDIRQARPKVENLESHLKKIKATIDACEKLSRSQKAILKAQIVETLIEECAAKWDPTHPRNVMKRHMVIDEIRFFIRPDPNAPPLPVHRRPLEQLLLEKEDVETFIQIYQQFNWIEASPRKDVDFMMLQKAEIIDIVQQAVPAAANHFYLKLWYLS